MYKSKRPLPVLSSIIIIIVVFVLYIISDYTKSNTFGLILIVLAIIYIWVIPFQQVKFFKTLAEETPEETKQETLWSYSHYEPELFLGMVSIFAFILSYNILGILLLLFVLIGIIRKKKIIQGIKNTNFASPKQLAMKKATVVFLTGSFIFQFLYNSNPFVHKHSLLILILLIIISLVIYFFGSKE